MGGRGGNGGGPETDRRRFLFSAMLKKKITKEAKTIPAELQRESIRTNFRAKNQAQGSGAIAISK